MIKNEDGGSYKPGTIATPTEGDALTVPYTPDAPVQVPVYAVPTTPNKSAIMAAQEAGVPQTQIKAATTPAAVPVPEANIDIKAIEDANAVQTTIPKVPTGGGGGGGGGTSTAVQQSAAAPALAPTVTETGTSSAASAPVAAPVAAPTPNNEASQKLLSELIESQKNLANPYMDKLQTMDFAYDPTTDQEYQMAAKQAETQISGMMIGRGGLYSSVASAALQTKLIELQLGYRSQAYGKFKDDRSFTQQMASMVYDKQNNDFSKGLQMVNTVSDMENTQFSQQMQLADYSMNVAKEAFNQQLQIAQYNADRIDAAWQKSYQSQQLQLSKASANYQRIQAEAATKLAGARATIETNVALVQKSQASFNSAYEAWSKSGTGGASKAVSDYFASIGVNVTQGTGFGSNTAVSAISAAQSAIQVAANRVTGQAVEYNQADIVQASINNFMGDTANTTSSDAYYSKWATDISGTYTSGDAIAYAKYMQENPDLYLAHISQEQYNKLLQSVNKRVIDLQ